MFIIAGPCVAESKEMLWETAETLSKICNKLILKLIFKASYKKANRTNIKSFTGIGDKIALQYLKEIADSFKIQVLTDVHSPEEAEMASSYVDVIQIPAFLSRQTDLLLAAGKTGKIVNIKKGQFMAPEDMKQAADKVASTGNNNIMLTERGTSFGYHNLVVDFRSLVIMKDFGYPVVYDATHSLQQPSAGEQSGGTPRYIPALSRAAAAVGVDGIFFETHPEPSKALSDSATQLPLILAEPFLEDIKTISELNFFLNY
jgi:2-dehydro-3-deoxyphosphooctonate aldolase (KDO 8-P synthase)